jgi:hypothetical protein
MTFFTCDTIADLVTDHIQLAMAGQYTAILLVGAAARNEITTGPNNVMLSDMDFLVVLPNKDLLYSLLKANHYKKITLEIERKVAKEYGVDISIGFANASRKYWSMATPFMWELRENALVLDGDNKVKGWPAIQLGGEIPEWEGVRLIANRICESLGKIGEISSQDEESMARIKYACLKLALACSEAVLINTHLYESTYQERQHQHNSVMNHFSDRNNDLIQKAYQAKLYQNLEFYGLDVQELIRDLFQCCITTLSEIGIKHHSDWRKRGWSERPYFIGFGTDILYFLENLFKGKVVAGRHAIMDVYSDAIEIGEKIASQTIFPYKKELHVECRNLYVRFKSAPQFVSVLK